jgi:hypothetical protein
MRPLTAGELLDAAFSAVRRNFGTLALCTLVAVVPVTILSTLVEASTAENAYDFTTPTVIEPDERGTYIAGAAISGLLTFVASALATAACLRAVGGDVLGQRVGFGESLSAAFKLLGPIILISVLSGLAILGGAFLLLVGAIYFAVLFSLATPALMFEDLRGRKALGRSRALVKDNWWRIFGVLVVMYLIVFVLQGLLVGGIGAAVLTDSDNEVVNAVLLTAAEIAGYAVSLPLLAALTAYIYFDQRVRKEGFDIQLLAERMGSGGPAPATPQSPQSVAGLPSDPPGGGFLPPRPPGG